MELIVRRDDLAAAIENLTDLEVADEARQWLKKIEREIVARRLSTWSRTRACRLSTAPGARPPGGHRQGEPLRPTTQFHFGKNVILFVAQLQGSGSVRVEIPARADPHL